MKNEFFQFEIFSKNEIFIFNVQARFGHLY